MTAAVSGAIELWLPYDGRSDLGLASRLSLIKAFAAVVRFRLGIEPHQLSFIVGAPGDEAENDCLKDLVALQSQYLIDDLLSGALRSVARPIGGCG